MAGTFSNLTIRDQNSERLEFFEQLEIAGTTTPAVRMQGEVVVQLSGTATNIEAIVEHATRDPSTSEANWAPAEDNPFSGDLANGMAPRPYVEPAIGWWRVRVPTLTGGHVKVSIVGERA